MSDKQNVWVKASAYKPQKEFEYRPFRRKRDDKDAPYDFGEIYITTDDDVIFFDINDERQYDKSTHERWNDFEILDETTSTVHPNQQITDHEHEKEVMMHAFDKIRKIFEGRNWIMEGRGLYSYNDDRYKEEEVRYIYDEFEAIRKETWAQILEWKKKAEKWDALGEKISEFYAEPEDDDYNEELDESGLIGIGEAAAIAFGYL